MSNGGVELQSQRAQARDLQGVTTRQAQATAGSPLFPAFSGPGASVGPDVPGERLSALLHLKFDATNSKERTPSSSRAVLQPQDQPSEGAAEGHAETLDPSTVESRGQSAAQSLNVSEEQREAAEYLAHFFKRWQEELSPAGQRKELKQEVIGDIRAQFDRFRHALQVELNGANARGDHRATQIIQYTLIRLIQGEQELRERIEKWTDRWMPNPGLPLRAGEFTKQLAIDPGADPLACIRHSTDAELEQYVWEFVEREKASQSRVFDKKEGKNVGWDAAVEARNKWIYDSCMKGTAYSTILNRLKRKPKTWEAIMSVNGIKKVATAYATRHALPLPPKRQPGRRSR